MNEIREFLKRYSESLPIPEGFEACNDLGRAWQPKMRYFQTALFRTADASKELRVVIEYVDYKAGDEVLP
jgi:hypothetical protein